MTGVNLARVWDNDINYLSGADTDRYGVKFGDTGYAACIDVDVWNNDFTLGVGATHGKFWVFGAGHSDVHTGHYVGTGFADNQGPVGSEVDIP